MHSLRHHGKMQPKLVRAIGLMSGTSLDGIDVALIETDGEARVERGAGRSFDYPPAFRRRLVEAIGEARSLTDRAARPGVLAEVERELTERHADAVADFLAGHELERGDIEIIGFHGQTVLHKPDTGLTVQLGDGALLAHLTGVDVIYDLRAADCAAGGEGAPLVPVYHRALVSGLADRPVAIVNIGGVANVTWIGNDGRLIAFDVGPGNALIDDWMLKRTGVARDEGGAAAGKGTVNEDVVRFYVNHSFFSTPPPKSLDRNAFFWDLVDGMSVEDGAATLTAFTAAALARAREHMPEEPRLWVIAGGGRKNRTLMGMIAERVENAVVPAEALRLDGDMVEAEAWAYMAVRSKLGLPITFPGTTGVERPMTGGVLVRGR